VQAWRDGPNRPDTIELRQAIEVATAGCVKACEWTRPAEAERAATLRAFIASRTTQEP
jgi:hypothetical protein